MATKKILLTSRDLEILDRYNKFLLEHGYTDTDVECEEPTAINMFIEEIGGKVVSN